MRSLEKDWCRNPVRWEWIIYQLKAMHHSPQLGGWRQENDTTIILIKRKKERKGERPNFASSGAQNNRKGAFFFLVRDDTHFKLGRESEKD